MNNIDKLKMHSPNLTDKNIAKIAEIFPNCTTEVLDENGKPKIAIDFELLQQELSGSLVGGGVERYQLNWPGKHEALLTANAPIAKTLRPVRDESVHFDTTENLFIEGDNLDALKLLQETYLGKVKMIYIDPPYNTGKDFVYADDFAENTEDYLRRSNQKDEDGNRMEVNSESNGRFHSDWLSMMYPRLKLARNLLADNGVIFISIDDNEQANLKRLCDEVFGERNFFADMVVIRSEGGGLAKKVIKGHDSLLTYVKNLGSFKGIFKPKDIRGKVVEKDGIQYWIEEDWLRREFGKYGTLLYEEIEEVKGIDKKIEIDEGIRQGSYILIPKNGKHIVGRLRRVDEDGTKFYSILKHLNKEGVKDLEQIKLNKFFEYPKPLSLVKELIQGTSLFTKNNNEIFLDFFAGSGTTAHAVMQLNAEDGGNRRFICVQLPEKTEEKSEAFKAGFTTIAEITKERIRRATDKIRNDFADKLPENWDGGFRVLKTDTSNMADVYYTPEETLKKIQQSQQDWLNQVSDNIKPDRTPEDLLFQVMLDWSVDLSLPIEIKQIMGRTVFFVDGNTLIACFDKQTVDNDFITALTKYRPLRAVFRDDSFKDDAAKINAGQIFQQYSESTEVKTI
ncbi:site-specific DNA-methyltransferase [Gallibacterium genomosp. 1]|uniref:site-specific DNA-methyltransferase n=1 Tax=Gallibacterium genomosp. 1 TaxID=155515 RepID=UPI000A581D3A|nr:site-specific DNA-methyltransferase [Gallibacterium genomosp. 1]